MRLLLLLQLLLLSFEYWWPCGQSMPNLRPCHLKIEDWLIEGSSFLLVLTSVSDPDSLILVSNPFLAEYQYGPKSGSGSRVLMTKNWKYLQLKFFFKLQFTHKVHLCLEYYSVCPLIRIGTLPPPNSPESMPLPPVPKKGGCAAHVCTLFSSTVNP